MRKPNPPKESPPQFTRVSRHLKRPLPSLGDLYVKEWNKLRTHRKFGETLLLAFSAKTYNHSTNIDLGRQVHVCFGKPTAHFPSNKIASQHPAWLLVECSQYSGVLRVSDAWLWDRSSPANPQLMTRVMGGKVIVYGFLHDKTQKFYLQEGSVFPRHINAFMRLLSPAYKGTYMLAGECAGYVDIVLAQERAHIAPRGLVTFKRLRLLFVSLLKKLWHPGIPSLVVAAYVALGCGQLPAQIARLPLVVSKSSFKTSTFTASSAVDVKETNPEVRAVFPAVQRGHEGNVEARCTPSKKKQRKSLLS